MSTLDQAIQRAWLSRGALACALWPLSLLYATLSGLRRLAYRLGWVRGTRLPVPVIVVGNRIAGGAGKTPTTIAVLRHLQAAGWRPGLLSRGYGGQRDRLEPLRLDAHTAAQRSARETGDEPMLIWRRTGVPAMVGARRAQAGQALLAAHPEIDILVCDDGLQHWALQRDIEIVVFDERGAGNGWLLPAGPLREGIHVTPVHPLAHEPIVLYNAPAPSTPLPGHLGHRRPGPLVPLEDWWRGVPVSTASPAPQGTVWAVAGIAHPQRFFDALTQQGLHVHPCPLPDHADLGQMPWPTEATQVVVTEKDAVKLVPDAVRAQRPRTQVWVSVLDFEPDAPFWVALDQALRRLRPTDRTA